MVKITGLRWWGGSIVAKKGDPISKQELCDMIQKGHTIADIMRRTVATRNKVEYYLDKYKIERPYSKFSSSKKKRKEPGEKPVVVSEFASHSNDELIGELIFNIIPGCKCPTCKIVNEIARRRAQNPHKNCDGGC